MTFGSPEFFKQQLQRFSQPGRESHVHVLLHSTNGNNADDPGAVECLEPFKLTERMWLCRMPDELRDVVYKACEPPGEPCEPAHRQYGQLYTIAFFLGTPEAGTVTSWDGNSYISKFVTYSQLVHPTSIGFGNTAVLIFGGDGEFKQARPGPCRGITEYAFTVRTCVTGSRNPNAKWLKACLTTQTSTNCRTESRARTGVSSIPRINTSSLLRSHNPACCVGHRFAGPHQDSR